MASLKKFAGDIQSHLKFSKKVKSDVMFKNKPFVMENTLKKSDSSIKGSENVWRVSEYMLQHKVASSELTIRG